MRGLSPSHANRFMNCGGSVELSQPYLDAAGREDSDAAREGTAAHWVAEMLFKGIDVLIGSESPSGFLVDEEMRECAREYVATLPAHACLEERLDLSMIAPGMVSYPDAWAMPGDGELHIWDFKYGHTYVEEFENWQLLMEAAGLMYSGVTRIHLHVVQPRCYTADTHRTWVLTADEYRTGYLPFIQKTVAQIITGNALCTTGKQCRNCPGARACVALSDVGYEAIDVSQGIETYDLTPYQLARELDVLHRATKRLEARIIGLEEQASALIKQGQRVPGYTLSPSPGRLGWRFPPEVTVPLAQAYGVDVKKPLSVITPTQAKAAGIPEAALKTMTTRPDKAPKLTKIDANQARKAFKK